MKGLKPSFGGGRSSKLTHDRLIELDKIIEKTPNMLMKDVHILVKDKFDVYYNLMQIRRSCEKIGVELQQSISKIFKITRRC